VITQINQAHALAGSITPGDTPGFPVTISVPGSYELTSNLEVPAASAQAIVITASHVTLNLNGFLIFKKAPDLPPAILAGPGVRFVAVSNGHIRGMGGIQLEGAGNRVEKVQLEGAAPQSLGIGLGDLGVAIHNQVMNADTAFTVGKNGLVKDNVAANSAHGVFAGENSIVEGNSLDGGAAQASIVVGHGSIVARNIAGANDAGIQAGSFCLVKENTVRNVGDFGIGVGDGSVVAGNRVNHVGHGPGITVGVACTVKDNAISVCGEGILATDGSAITANAVGQCIGLGLHLGPSSGYASNVLVGNNGAGPQASGGLQTGKNVCGTGLCP
jgi:hypothetical protein